MERNIQHLSEATFDILVIGGGIYGAAIAREAATRGLHVALIEQNDFCSGTSANSLKIIHGGLRYLQQMDLPRVMESIRERRIWLQTAPYLVEPLTCMMPTHRSLMRNRCVMSCGMALNDVLSAGRNRGVHRARRLAPCRTISKEACLQTLPELNGGGVTGGAIWHDAVGFDTERIVMAILLDAVDAGACMANYVRARELVVRDGAIREVHAEDRLTGKPLTLRADVVINAAGPWASELLETAEVKLSRPFRHLALGINLILKRWPIRDMAVGLTAGPGTPSGGRLFFFVPWRGVVMAGTYYRPYDGSLDDVRVTEADLDAYLDALNSCYPNVGLTRSDIAMVHAGVLPATHAVDAGKEPPLLRHYRMIDHGNADGVEGLLSVLGVKYTTARDVAQHAVAAAVRRLSCPRVRSTTSTRPLAGNVVGSLAGYREATIAKYGSVAPVPVIDRLCRFYGSGMDAMLVSDASGNLLKGSDDVLECEIRHVVENEMPLTLGDLVFRRTGLGAKGNLDPTIVRSCGELMGALRGWDAQRLEREIAAVTETTCLWQAATQLPATIS